MKSISRQSRVLGFTLIEMMIVIAAMGVLVSVGVASYRTFNSKQEVVNAGAELGSVFRLAQKKAKSGEKPASCVSGSETLSGYKVTGSISQSQIDLVAVCSGGDVTDSTLFLPFNIVSTSTFEMTFSVLTGGVLNAGTIGVSDVNGTYTYDVEVTATGAINELGMQ